MHNHKLKAAGALTLLGGIGFLMNLRPGILKADGDKKTETVTINPAQLPLPVTGSTTVSGTLAATQSGAWNVGIVGNSGTVPFFSTDPDRDARHAWSQYLLIPAISDGGQTQANDFFTPSDRAFVIESISARCVVVPGKQCGIRIQPNALTSLALLQMNMTRDVSDIGNGPGDVYVGNQTVHVVISPANQVAVELIRGTTSGNSGQVNDAWVSFFGHYVVCNAGTPCMAQ